MKIAVTGSSGLIGTALMASLRADGHEVIRLVRRAPRAADELRWDPRAADAGLATAGLDGLDACVHLAGAGVADRRWTARYKAEIRASRVLGTRALVGLLPRFASGRQVMSWIALSDEIGAIRFLLDRKDISGPVNLTAPEAATDAEFTAALTAAVGRRDLPWLRVPAPALRLRL